MHSRSVQQAEHSERIDSTVFAQFTMCDDSFVTDRFIREKLLPRIREGGGGIGQPSSPNAGVSDTASDGRISPTKKGMVKAVSTVKGAATLEPHGWVVTTNRPVEDDSLSAHEMLEEQGRIEEVWLTAEERLPPSRLDKSRVGCNALIAKMKNAFFDYVKVSWAPATIFELDYEAERLELEQRKLGLPAAHTASAVDKIDLVAAATAAAMRVLNEEMPELISTAFQTAVAYYEASLQASKAQWPHENPPC